MEKKIDIKYYHEEREHWKVEVLSIEKKSYGKSDGKEYSLKILEVLRTRVSNPPQVGLEFKVWQADNASAYAGRHLLDR